MVVYRRPGRLLFPKRYLVKMCLYLTEWSLEYEYLRVHCSSISLRNGVLGALLSARSPSPGDRIPTKPRAPVA